MADYEETLEANKKRRQAKVDELTQSGSNLASSGQDLELTEEKINRMLWETYPRSCSLCHPSEISCGVLLCWLRFFHFHCRIRLNCAVLWRVLGNSVVSGPIRSRSKFYIIFSPHCCLSPSLPPSHSTSVYVSTSVATFH